MFTHDQSFLPDLRGVFRSAYNYLEIPYDGEGCGTVRFAMIRKLSWTWLEGSTCGMVIWIANGLASPSASSTVP